MQRAGINRADEALKLGDAPERPGPLELEGVSLFLDLDGVLAPIVARPEEVRPVAVRTRLMQALQTALSGRLAVISGRTIADLEGSDDVTDLHVQEALLLRCQRDLLLGKERR